MNSSRLVLLPLLSGALLAALPARADVRLPSIISDNMVLMQEVPVNVWGWAEPQEEVTVKLGDKSATGTTDFDGKWHLKLAGLEPGLVGDMTVTGKNTLTVKNVAVGEVWVCSGQSNMEMAVGSSNNAAEEIKNSANPQIRMFTVARGAKADPQEECAGKWEVADPAVTGHFSAVAYFFGRLLNEKVKVPIGLIHTSWGGTPIEFWMPTEILQADPDFQGIISHWADVKAKYPKAKADYDEALAKWKAIAEEAKAAGKPTPPTPSFPPGGDDFGAPGCLYNAMIAPILPYTIRGATWYQGESNAGNARLYAKLFPTMIVSWREKWNLPEFPFFFVQLASFMARAEQPSESQWAELREAQLQTLNLSHTGMAVAIDIGDEKDIHPKNKQEVGRRLALNALATVYYEETEYSGPLPSDIQVEDNRIRVTFRHSEGLKTTDGKPPKSFAIAGEDKKYVWADAEIQGDHVVVQSPQVPKPLTVRYAWANNPEVNLVNGAGLPASPFRSDDALSAAH